MEVEPEAEPEEQCRVPSPSSAEASIVSASDMTVSNAAVSPTMLEHSEEEQERASGEEELPHELDLTAAEVRDIGKGEAAKNGEGGDMEASQQQEQEWEDILGNGQLLKKVIRKGNGISTRPTPQSRVKVRSQGFLESGEVVEKRSGHCFTVGDGDVVQAWDIAVTLMECGEVAKVRSSARFAYGERGKAGIIPSNATITYELELLEVLEPIKFGSLTEEELIKLVERKKTRGNELYQGKEYNRATNSYQKGLQAIHSYLDKRSMETNVPSSVQEMQIRCLNNIAAAQLKMRQYNEALSACESVLQKDSNNVKALYRAGRVLSHLGEMESAVAKLQKALTLSPQDKAIQLELKNVSKKKALALQKERAMYRRMVGTDTASSKTSSHRDSTWGPLPYMAVAGVAATIAMGIAYFFTQRQVLN